MSPGSFVIFWMSTSPEKFFEEGSSSKRVVDADLGLLANRYIELCCF
jgi:hypothetical protein